PRAAVASLIFLAVAWAASRARRSSGRGTLRGPFLETAAADRRVVVDFTTMAYHARRERSRRGVARYITSLRRAYLAPLVTTQPSCRTMCWNRSAVPVCGTTA